MRHRSPVRAVALLVLAATLASALAWKSASADSSTPVPEGATPVETAVVTIAPTLAPTAMDLPTVTQERSTPIATSIAIPTAAPTAAGTSAPIVRQTATPPPSTTQPVVPQPVATASPPAIAWPSPEQLRENARIRWGKGIPSSVRRWAFLLMAAARKYGLDPNLLAAVMTMESNGDPLAWSSADARGLMQVLHGPWDPRQNVFEGARMLSSLWTRYADWTLVLAAYNAGPGAVDAYGGVPPYRETRDYVVIVGYLWDLYSRHKISLHRRSLYRKSLLDLQHFADQRKKVTKLAKIAHIPVDKPSLCATNDCVSVTPDTSFETFDPFWPVGGTPDPLQVVGPYARAP